LHELRVDVTKPAARGREAETMVVPVIAWAPETGLAAEGLELGTPVTIVGRVSARTWTSPTGAEKVFVEIICESLTVDVSAVGAPSETAPAARPVAEPAAPSRPASARTAARGEVPF
jgi:single-stranded DNA-binding protein